jgi:protein phosphatase
MNQIQLDIHPFTDRGRRDHQEDYFYTDPPARQGAPWLGLVADGMGGHRNGDVASRIGVQAVRAAFDAGVAARGSTEVTLAKAVERGHEAVVDAAARAGASGDMGSTIVAFAIDGPTLHWCSAGDSRLYLYRAEKLVQLSQDFTLAEDMRRGISDGNWTEGDIENSPQRKALTSFMGTDSWRCDTGIKPLQHGDIIIACSDGVYGTIECDGISAACRTAGGAPSAKEIAENMLARVLEVGKSNQDNSTAIIVRFVLLKEAIGKGNGNSIGWRTSAMAGIGVLALAGIGVAGYSYINPGPVPVPAPVPSPLTAVSGPASVAQATALETTKTPPTTPSAPKSGIKNADYWIGRLEQVESIRAQSGHIDAEAALTSIERIAVEWKHAGLDNAATALVAKKTNALHDKYWVQRLSERIALAASKSAAEASAFLKMVVLTDQQKAEVDKLGAEAKAKAKVLMSSALKMQKQKEKEAEAKKNDEIDLKPTTTSGTPQVTTSTSTPSNGGDAMVLPVTPPLTQTSEPN